MRIVHFRLRIVFQSDRRSHVLEESDQILILGADVDGDVLKRNPHLHQQQLDRIAQSGFPVLESSYCSHSREARSPVRQGGVIEDGFRVLGSDAILVHADSFFRNPLLRDIGLQCTNRGSDEVHARVYS